MIEKKRKFRLDTENSSSFERLEFTISSMPGVLEAELDRDTGVIVITYDLLRTDFTTIEDRLNQHDISLCTRPLWAKVHAGLIRYLEQNERENYVAKPTGCCAGFDKGNDLSNKRRSRVTTTLQPM